MPVKIYQDIEEILKNYKRIAVVGVSNKPERDSHAVAKFMISKNYQVYPVNPNCQKIFDIPCYKDLKQIPDPVDLVDIFRKSEFVEPIVDEAIEIGAKAIWMQLGVINHNAAEKALRAGIKVVMDRCWKIEYIAHFGR
jgi:predicted CoA-binding protein